jgi:hypothetical protein
VGAGDPVDKDPELFSTCPRSLLRTNNVSDLRDQELRPKLVPVALVDGGCSPSIFIHSRYYFSLYFMEELALRWLVLHNVQIHMLDSIKSSNFPVPSRTN